MNISYNKWKWALFIGTIIIFLAIIWYSNVIIDDIAKEERNKIKIWANAIHKKASLIKYTNEFFKTIQKEEQYKANIMAKAFQRINNASPYEDISFYSELISENKSIPYILTDKQGNISAIKNLDSAYLKTIDTPEKLFKVIKEENYGVIPINYYKNHYIYLYYKESYIYSQLREVFNDIVESFLSEIVENSSSIPVIVTDSSKKNVIAYGNIDTLILTSPERLAETIALMEYENSPLKISLGENNDGYVFYQGSYLLKRLRIFPVIQFVLVLIFFTVAYFLFNYAWKSEQNQVWVGMSKETAHQLGTPLSSLLAWLELLRAENVDHNILSEMEKDISRLETTAQRFSKIGSMPCLKVENIQEVIRNFIEYFKDRTSEKIKFKLKLPENDIFININKYLFEWVIENLCKNAVDAMDGQGTITITLIEEKRHVYIEVQDTGKGINSKYQKKIFKPGFTTKNRGWGLGLTLSLRIIKNYHKGKINVKKSTSNKGTTFRIKLKK